MSRLITVAQVLEMDPDETVPGVHGIVDSIAEQNRGSNDYGPWTLQNMVIKDLDGRAKIKVKIGDRDAVPLHVRGQQVWLTSTSGEHGLTGLKVKFDKVKGRQTDKKILSATKTADIAFEERRATPKAAPPKAEKTQAPPPTRRATGGASAPPPAARKPPEVKPDAETKKVETFEEARERGYTEAVKKAYSRARKLANGYKLALRAAHHVLEWHQQAYDLPLTPTHFERITASIYIGMEKSAEYLDCIAELPSGDMTAYGLPPVPKATADGAHTATPEPGGQP